MDPITSAIVIIGINFAAAAVSKSAATKMEEYRKVAQKDAQKRMLELSGAMYRERLESDRKMHAFVLEQQRRGNAENLGIIAEQIEAYTKWPLNVPPVALRGSLSLLPDEMIDTAERQPCFLLVAPGADKETNKLLDALQESVFEYTSSYLTAARGHNVVLLKDCWANSLKECGEIEARNIHSFVKDVPMIVVSPYDSTPGEVSFMLSMWNIFDRNAGQKMSYSFGETLKMKNSKNVKALANDLCAFVTYISDCYGWIHYRETPQLPVLASRGVLSLSEEVADSYYGEYVKLLGEMSNKGLLSKLDESDVILEYCRAVDGVMQRNGAFAAAGFIGSTKNSALLSMPKNLQASVWSYIAENPIAEQVLSGASLHELKSECLRRNWMKALEDCPSVSSKICSSGIFMEIVKKRRRKILLLGADVKKQGLDKMRAITEMVDLRNALRPILQAESHRRFKSEIYPELIYDLMSEIVRMHNKYVNEQILETGKKLNHCLLDADAFSDVGVAVATDIHEEFKTSLSMDTLKELADKHFRIMNIGQWVQTVAYDWIDYVFLGHDIVHKDMWSVKSQKEDDLFYENVRYSISYTLGNITKELLGEEDRYSSSDDSRSSDDTFFDYVVMSPSF